MPTVILVTILQIFRQIVPDEMNYHFAFLTFFEI